jgi:hypothetical protein
MTVCAGIMNLRCPENYFSVYSAHEERPALSKSRTRVENGAAEKI